MVKKPKKVHDYTYNDDKDITLLRQFKPKTDNQIEYVRTIAECQVTICHGPAGSGKSACAVALACEYLAMGKINSIVIARPIIETGRSIGFLPGTFQDKVHPYLRPILDEMISFFGPLYLTDMIKKDIIAIEPLQYMRGRNFHNAFMILDEAQNAEPGETKMFLTRIGRNSKAVLNGDLTQSDIGIKSGLEVAIQKLKDMTEVGVVQLTKQDIVRSGIIGKILDKWET